MTLLLSFDDRPKIGYGLRHMKLTFFRGHQPNFGDELNWWLWPQLLPDFFDDDDSVLFLGIGSIIGDSYGKAAKKIVFGSAFVPEYHTKPDVHGSDWHIYFVRGPRTAHLLNISPDLALGDSAILLRTVVDARRKSAEVVSFVPHWERVDCGHWEQVCRLAGVNFIDPRRPVEAVISELLRSRLVITEAMHGAIVADALRIPWIPLLPISPDHRGKWLDWAEALGINLHPYRHWASSIAEASQATKYRPKLGPLMRALASSPLSGVIDKGMIHAAAHRLSRLAKAHPSLSADREMDRATERMLDKVTQLRRDYMTAPLCPRF